MQRQKKFSNAGVSRDERIQNTFTRYLTRALDRENARFRYKQRENQKIISYQEEEDDPSGTKFAATLAEHEPVLESRPHSWQDFLQQVDTGWLYAALQTLTQKEASILYWHIILDLSYTQIEATTGVPVYEAQKRYAMAIRKLRKAMRRWINHDL